MQGGATGLFAAIALNLIGKTGTADYVVTGDRFFFMLLSNLLYRHTVHHLFYLN